MLYNNAVPKYYGEFRDKVLKGEILVNELISLEMNRIDELIRNPTIYYDPAPVEGWIHFCEEEMVLSDGSDVHLLESFKLWGEQALCWYYFTERKVYEPGENGSKGRHVTKLVKQRLIKKQIIIVPRSNAKTLYDTFMAAYELTLSPDAIEIFVTAPTIRQSEEIINPFKTALALSKGPMFRFMTRGSSKNTRGNVGSVPILSPTKEGITNTLTNSYIEKRPMTIDKFQGFRPKLTVVDEWLSGVTRENIISAIEQGSSKVLNYLIIMTSSEGTVRDGVGDDIKMEAVSILKNEYINPHASIFYYKQDDIKEIGDPRLWIKSNPNIGITVSYESIQLDLERAEKSPSAKNDILAKRFNEPSEGTSYFFTYEETLLHSKREYIGVPCALGMDASLGDDFWSFVFLIPLNGGKFAVKTLNFITRTTYMKLSPALKYKYDLFLNEGSLIIHEKPTLDKDDIYDDLEEYLEAHQIDVLAFGYDPYNASGFVTRWVTEHGDFGVYKVQQGFRTESVPLGELKTLAELRYLSFDQEIFKFSMGNSIILKDNNGNKKLYKARLDKKIDAVAACMDAYVAYKAEKESFE